MRCLPIPQLESSNGTAGVLGRGSTDRCHTYSCDAESQMTCNWCHVWPVAAREPRPKRNDPSNVGTSATVKACSASTAVKLAPVFSPRVNAAKAILPTALPMTACWLGRSSNVLPKASCRSAPTPIVRSIMRLRSSAPGVRTTVVTLGLAVLGGDETRTEGWRTRLAIVVESVSDAIGCKICVAGGKTAMIAWWAANKSSLKGKGEKTVLFAAAATSEATRVHSSSKPAKIT
mmetsp:Transcript_68844/g.183364  ORF Transcript_68844/g.183364 Transcript_68844/m.183364 type:complete len:232 (+) Transcript_68844:3154-3849(+)